MKKSSKVLIACLAINITFLLSLVILFSLSTLSENDFFSYLAGNLFAFLNLFLGILSIRLGINKSDKIFTGMLWGGVFIRLVLMILLVIISLKFLEFRTVSFIFSLFIFYFFNLFCEIFYLNSRKN